MVAMVDGAAGTYSVQDALRAACTVEPLKCPACQDVGNSTFNQAVGDAYCAACGTWHTEETDG